MTSQQSDLLAFSSILGGLLASGHFTRPEQGDSKPSVIRENFDTDWRESFPNDPLVYQQWSPRVLQVAEELFEATKAFTYETE